MEPGQIRIVHVKEDILKRAGAKLQTVEKASPEQRGSRSPDSTRVRKAEKLLPVFLLAV